MLSEVGGRGESGDREEQQCLGLGLLLSVLLFFLCVDIPGIH